MYSSVFASLGMDNDLLSEAPHTPQAKKVGGSLQLSAVGGGATVMNGNANASPTFGGAGGGSTFAVLPNGVTLPWSPAHKDVSEERVCFGRWEPIGRKDRRGTNEDAHSDLGTWH